ncbi:MAG: PAS domain S-box protein, partial [Chitinivibrionales bacterium]|nr:PAS domain S-box protein [Chitinivibrionales bacterium]
MRRLLSEIKHRIDEAFCAHPYGWGWVFAISSGAVLGIYDIAISGAATHVRELLLPEQFVFHFGLPFIFGASVSRHGKKLSEERARHKAESELAESEEKHRSLAANIPGVVYRRYVRENDRMEFFTPDAVTELTGYSANELVGNDGASFAELMDLPGSPDSEDRDPAADTHGSFEREYAIRRKDGERRHVLERGRIIPDEGGRELFVDGVIFDITDRRQMQDALRAERDFAESLVQSAQVMVIVLSPEGRILRYNPYTEEVLRQSLNESKQLDWFDTFVPEADRRSARERFTTALREGSAPATLATVETADGQVREILWHERALRGGEGPPIGVLAVGHDITERRRLEERLHQSEKMQAIGQLAGGVAHDFNNQLSGILGYAEMAREQVEDGSRMARYLDHILLAAQRSADLTAKLLAFARRGKFRSVPLNMHDLIAEVVSVLERSIDRRIRIEQDLKAEPPTTRGDPTLLQNAILNVALNARDALPEGGRITFQTDVTMLDKTFCEASPFSLEPGAFLHITVSDDGSGMDEETRRRIFEPFFTTKAHGQGNGMGLAAVYGTIKTHKGAIDVISAPGLGTLFTIYLPLLETPDDPNVYSSATDVRRGSGTVLFVDDETVLCDMVSEALGELGYAVHVCYDGDQALEHYREKWRQTDLVILDLVMPRMAGGETFEAMKEINPDIVALIASGYSVDGEAQKL